MKLSRALKLKKKIAGEIVQLQNLITHENVQIEPNTSRFKTPELLEKLIEKQTKLIDLKTQIAKSNEPIWRLIFQSAELKGRILFLRGLNTNEGIIKRESYRGDPVPEKHIPQINKAQVEDQITALEKQIEQLQEDIDTYNYSHDLLE